MNHRVDMQVINALNEDKQLIDISSIYDTENDVKSLEEKLQDLEEKVNNIQDNSSSSSNKKMRRFYPIPSFDGTYPDIGVEWLKVFNTASLYYVSNKFNNNYNYCIYDYLKNCLLFPNGTIKYISATSSDEETIDNCSYNVNLNIDNRVLNINLNIQSVLNVADLANTFESLRNNLLQNCPNEWNGNNVGINNNFYNVLKKYIDDYDKISFNVINNSGSNLRIIVADFSYIDADEGKEIDSGFQIFEINLDETVTLYKTGNIYKEAVVYCDTSKPYSDYSEINYLLPCVFNISINNVNYVENSMFEDPEIIEFPVGVRTIGNYSDWQEIAAVVSDIPLTAFNTKNYCYFDISSGDTSLNSSYQSFGNTSTDLRNNMVSYRVNGRTNQSIRKNLNYGWTCQLPADQSNTNSTEAYFKFNFKDEEGTPLEIIKLFILNDMNEVYKFYNNNNNTSENPNSYLAYSDLFYNKNPTPYTDRYWSTHYFLGSYFNLGNWEKLPVNSTPLGPWFSKKKIKFRYEIYNYSNLNYRFTGTPYTASISGAQATQATTVGDSSFLIINSDKNIDIIIPSKEMNSFEVEVSLNTTDKQGINSRPSSSTITSLRSDLTAAYSLDNSSFSIYTNDYLFIHNAILEVI